MTKLWYCFEWFTVNDIFSWKTGKCFSYMRHQIFQLSVNSVDFVWTQPEWQRIISQWLFQYREVQLLPIKVPWKSTNVPLRRLQRLTTMLPQIRRAGYGKKAKLTRYVKNGLFVNIWQRWKIILLSQLIFQLTTYIIFPL